MIKRYLKRYALGLLTAALLIPIIISAQGKSLQWDQAGNGDSLSTVNLYTYKLYNNGVLLTTLTGVTCVGTASPFTCTVPLPTLPTGTDGLTVTSSSGGLESAQSVPLSLPVPPATPVNLRTK